MYDLFFGKNEIDIYNEIFCYDFFIFSKNRNIFPTDVNVRKIVIEVTSINDRCIYPVQVH